VQVKVEIGGRLDKSGAPDAGNGGEYDEKYQDEEVNLPTASFRELIDPGFYHFML
jgi:hypothetical protein